MYRDAPPLTPDEETARDWVLQELSKPEYFQAKPSPIDEFLGNFWEWLTGLFSGDGEGSAFGVEPGWLATIIALIVAVILVVLLGRPRAIAARRATQSASVFLDDDTRTARELREAAARAAASGQWSLAFAEQYRAMCRSLQDRTLITLRPGDTARAAAQAAAHVFPEHETPLRRAAVGFDRVRYLGREVGESDYAALRELDATLERSRPALPAENQPAALAGTAGTRGPR